MHFPIYRPRRLRKNETIRRMVRETKLSPDDFVYPSSSSTGGGSAGNQIHAGDRPALRGYGGSGGGGSLPAGYPRGDPLRHPREEGRRGSEAYARHGNHPAGHPRHQEASPRTWWSSPTSASASTPSHGHCGVIEDGRGATTMRPWSCWRRWPFPMPRPARTWWPRRT